MLVSDKHSSNKVLVFVDHDKTAVNPGAFA
jgi:hypothetical protein